MVRVVGVKESKGRERVCGLRRKYAGLRHQYYAHWSMDNLEISHVCPNLLLQPNIG